VKTYFGQHVQNSNPRCFISLSISVIQMDFVISTVAISRSGECTGDFIKEVVYVPVSLCHVNTERGRAFCLQAV